MVEENYDEEEQAGFRFCPSDQELIVHYLSLKVANQPNPYFELDEKDDIYKKEPWLLSHTETDFFEPDEWFYFVNKTQLFDKVTGKQTKRKVEGETCQGCWKATGKLLDIETEDGLVIGKKRSLSFYVKGEKKASGWTMIEYSLVVGDSSQNQVLCHLKAP